MILSGNQINKLLDSGELKIQPTPQVKEASIKIHFSETFVLKPKEFRITNSKEKVSLPAHIAGFYDGCAKISKQGMMTHLGSMFIDPGFEGTITLEMFNASDNEISINENDRAGHIVFMEVKP
ncbi:MAG: hypothetical protein WC841_03670 [Candidatus Shapirobacteria bacterium]|jgi:dCTP deaminase